MGNCLVTKLKGVVDNEELLKLDEFDIYTNVDPVNNSVISVKYRTAGNTVRIIGNGYFTDSSHQTPQGKTFTVASANVDTPLYFIANDTDVRLVFSNKGDIIRFDFSYRQCLNGNSIPFLGFSSMTHYTSRAAGFRVNVKDFPASLEFTDIDGGVIEGNVASFPTFVDGCSFTARRTTGTLYGDLAETTGIYWFNVSAGSDDNSPISLGWSGRPSTKQALLTVGVDFGDSLDNYLIDTAAEDVNPLVPGTYMAVISVYGTRTSASDAAVATLKGKGITVRINGEVQ